MKEQLNLEHIASYLPYELIVKIIGKHHDYPYFKMTVEPEGKNTASIAWIMSEPKRFKPLLHPLPDIIKEIIYKGNTVVPLVQILARISLLDLSECEFEVGEFANKYWVKASTKEGKHMDSLSFDGNLFTSANNDESFSFTNPQHEALVMLNMFHFDWKYNLIEKGLALDINTI
jgi:hypothetical protein